MGILILPYAIIASSFIYTSMTKFLKMAGCGNDFIIFDAINNPAPLLNKRTIQRLCNRNLGIGADGIAVIRPSQEADAKMEIFNADGSRAKMCGNAIRCVARYLFDKQIVNRKEIKIETDSGIKHARVLKEDVSVEMGEARIINLVGGGIEIDVGNPHIVFFQEPNEDIIKKHISTHNVEFARIVSDREIDMRVFERGVGETLACGTGAVAVAAASIYKGLCGSNEILVRMRGGRLRIKIGSAQAIMRGNAEYIFQGEIKI